MLTEEGTLPDTATNFRLSRSQFVPLYRRIEIEMRERIRSGTWAAGQILPGRRAIAKEFGVDVNTFQRAITPLLKDGTLLVQSGRGTFVPESSEELADQDDTRIAPKYQSTNRSVKNGNGARILEHSLNATVGVIAGYDPADMRMHSVVEAIEHRASQAGVKTNFVNVLDPELPTMPPIRPIDDVIQSFVDQEIDAVIIVELYAIPGIVETVIQAVRSVDIPIVLVTWRDAHRPILQVSYDNRMASYVAADHLIECGYDPIIFFAPARADWVTERIEGAQQALVDRGWTGRALRVLPDTRTENEFQPKQARVLESLLPFLSEPVARPGFIVANDGIAHELMRFVAAQGLALGTDFGVVGFDDEPLSRFVGLTTTRPPLEQLGAEAMRLVQTALRGDMRPVQVRLNSDLIVRLSTSGADA